MSTENRKSAFVKYRRLQVSAQSFFQVCQGLLFGIVGPSMVELAQLYSVDYGALSLAVGAKGLGMLLGCPIGGVFKDYFINRLDVIMSVVLVLEAIATIAMPFCPNITSLVFANILHGLCWGSANVVNVSYLAMLWGIQSGVYLNLVLSCTALGKVLGPQVIGPFLKIKQDIRLYNQTSISIYISGRPWLHEHSHPSSNTDSKIAWYKINSPLKTSTSLPSNTNHFSKLLPGTHNLEIITFPTKADPGEHLTTESTLYMGFVICFCALLFNAFVFFISYLVKPRSYIVRQYSEEQEDPSQAKPSAVNMSWNKGMFSLSLFILCALFNICMEASGIYLFSVAMTETLSFSVHGATLYNSMFYISLSIGRISASLVLKLFTKITPPVLLNFCLVCSVAGGICMVHLGLKSKLAFWITTLIYIFFLAPSYPTSFAYAKHFVPLTGLMTAVLDVGFAVGYMLSTDITGAVFVSFGAGATLWLLFVVVAVCPVVSLVVYLFGRRLQKRDAEKTPLLSKDEANNNEQK